VSVHILQILLRAGWRGVAYRSDRGLAPALACAALANRSGGGSCSRRPQRSYNLDRDNLNKFAASHVDREPDETNWTKRNVRAAGRASLISADRGLKNPAPSNEAATPNRQAAACRS